MHHTENDTIIAEHIVIEGEIVGSAGIVVEGRVKGKIAMAGRIDIAESGQVDATIEAPEVHVAGQVTGNIIAVDRIQMESTCRMIGNAKAKRILIADGAYFAGNVEMGSN